jgi:hypothetical protein
MKGLPPAGWVLAIAAAIAFAVWLIRALLAAFP